MMESDKFPLAPPHNYVRSDQEVSQAARELRRKKRRKRIQSIASFVVLLIVVVSVYAVVVTRFKTPKFRLRAASITSFEISNNTNNNSSKPSINVGLNAQFTVKNRNFARFIYESGSVVFAYRGFPLGRAFIDGARVRARTTKKVDAVVVLNSAGMDSQAESELGRDIGAGVVSLTSYSELEGMIQVVRVLKKKKSPKLNCTMDIEIPTRTIQNLKCI
ncbi:uncharacterized protein LOC133834641 [Humulus lupulus]|uniref:uncharacterized protein LOC133834641 n=1 Tax=Humulus lupulus TaxID=3486 RepID=UPI002B41458D|nr:uncharacterized protein LOC133834641 [Humulus lupulus]